MIIVSSDITKNKNSKFDLNLVIVFTLSIYVSIEYVESNSAMIYRYTTMKKSEIVNTVNNMSHQ